MPDETTPLPSDADELTGTLAVAVRQIRAVPVPPALVARFIERAAAWPEPRPAPPRSAAWALVAAAALLIAVGVGALMYWWGQWPEPDVPVNPGVSVKQTPAGKLWEVPPMSAKKQNTAPTPKQAPGGNLAGATRCPFHAVAGDATVLVSTGGAKPIPLGATVPFDPVCTIHVWDWSKGPESRVLKVNNSGAMAVSPDGKWIVFRDGQLVDAATGAVKQLDHFDGQVHGLHFAPDGRTLLLTVNQAQDVAVARVLDFPECKKRFEIPGQWSYTFACAFTADSKQFFLTDRDRVLHRWDAATGKELGKYEPAFTNSVRAIAVSADGKLVAATGTRGDLHVWEVAGGKRLHTLTAPDDPTLTELAGSGSLAFSPDGKLLATGGFMRASLWDTATGKVVRQLPRASAGAGHVRFSRGGKQLTTVSEFFGTGAAKENLQIYPAVRVWDVDSGKEVNNG
jgi:WD40 repeat protein